MIKNFLIGCLIVAILCGTLVAQTQSSDLIISNTFGYSTQIDMTKFMTLSKPCSGPEPYAAQCTQHFLICMSSTNLTSCITVAPGQNNYAIIASEKLPSGSILHTEVGSLEASVNNLGVTTGKLPF